MAEHHHTIKQEECVPVESQDRGLFDFMPKKPQGETISHEFEDEVHVPEPEHNVEEEHKEEEKQESLIQRQIDVELLESSVHLQTMSSSENLLWDVSLSGTVSLLNTSREVPFLDAPVVIEGATPESPNEKFPEGGQKKAVKVQPLAAPVVIDIATTETPNEKKA